jgi:predicted nucleic acid-binding protein
VISHLAKPLYFLDSTTLVNALNRNAAYHAECLQIINKAAKGEISATVSLETLEESLFIASKATSPSFAIRAIRDYLAMSKLKKVEMTAHLLEHAMELMEIHHLKHPKDAINVATMVENGITHIVSEDADYDKVSLIRRIHPKDFPMGAGFT